MEYTQPQQKPKERPTAVTIIAILYVVSAIVWFGMGAMYGIIGLEFLPVAGAICFAIPAIFGLLYLGIAYGLWTGQNWARMVAIVFAVIGLIGFPIVTIISIIMLIFLFKDEVKAYFKEGTQQQPSQQQGWQQQQQPPGQQEKSACPDCGNPLRYVEEHDRWYCDNCQEYK